MRRIRTYRWDALLKLIPEDKPITAAEIGVWQGQTSMQLLKQRPDLRLYMVDRWKAPSPEDSFYGTDKLSRYPQSVYDEALSKAVSAVRSVDPKAERHRILHLPSEEAAELIPDQSLDFIFIDGDHSYDGCFRDLTLWVPKVKIGGIVSGHDYGRPEKGQVKEAVHDFFGDLKSIKLTDHYCWWCYR